MPVSTTCRATSSPAREPADRLADALRHAEAGAEVGQRAGEVEAGIGELGPAAERRAVLLLLDAPAFDFGEEGGVVGEHAAEIGDIVGGVGLDQRGGLDHGEQVGVDRAGVEALPGDVVEGPAGHRIVNSKVVAA